MGSWFLYQLISLSSLDQDSSHQSLPTAPGQIFTDDTGIIYLYRNIDKASHFGEIRHTILSPDEEISCPLSSRLGPILGKILCTNIMDQIYPWAYNLILFYYLGTNFPSTNYIIICTNIYVAFNFIKIIRFFMWFYWSCTYKLVCKNGKTK